MSRTQEHVTLSWHGLVRLRERAPRMGGRPPLMLAQEAYDQGLDDLDMRQRAPAFAGYIDHVVQKRKRRGTRLRAHLGLIFVFYQHELVTVFQMPADLALALERRAA